MKLSYKKYCFLLFLISGSCDTIKPSEHVTSLTIFTGIIASTMAQQSINKLLKQKENDVEESVPLLESIHSEIDNFAHISFHEEMCALQELHVKIQEAKALCYKIKSSSLATQADEIPQNIITRYFRTSLQKDTNNNIRAEVYRTLFNERLERKYIGRGQSFLKHPEALMYSFTLYWNKDKKPCESQSQAIYYYPHAKKRIIDTTKESITTRWLDPDEKKSRRMKTFIFHKSYLDIS